MTFLSFLLLTSVARGEELITPLKEGEAAPYTGVLFNDEAAAALKVKLQFSQERCQLQIDEAVALNSIESELKIEMSEISEQSCEERYNSMMELNDKHVSDLTTLLNTSPPRKTIAPYAAGTLTGIGAAILTAYAYSQIEKHSR